MQLFEEVTADVLGAPRSGQGLCRTADGNWLHVSFSRQGRHKVRGPLPDTGFLEPRAALGASLYPMATVRRLLADRYADADKSLDLSIDDGSALAEACAAIDELGDQPVDAQERSIDSRVTVPLTQLRHFYWTLLELGKDAREGIAISLVKSRRKTPLLEGLFADALAHVDRVYDPPRDVKLMAATPRRALREDKTAADFVSRFREQQHLHATAKSPGDRRADLRYLDREVSPLRTPGAQWADGVRARSSGSGGIDVLAATNEEAPHLAVLELKAKTDTDLLLALVQSLTYCSELVAGERQLARVAAQYPGELDKAPTAADIWLIYEPKGRSDSITNAVTRLIEAFPAREDRASGDRLRRIVLAELHVSDGTYAVRECAATP